MTTESKIVYRADSSEVRRATGDIKASAAAIQKLTAGTSFDPKIALERAKGESKLSAIRAQSEAKFGLAHQKNIAGIVERRQKSEIALEKQRLSIGSKEATMRARLESKRSSSAGSVAKSSIASGGFARDVSQGTGGLSLTDLKSGFDMALGIAKTVGAVVISAGVALGKAQSFKESTLKAASVYLGSAEKANAFFAKGMKFADTFGQDAIQTIGGMQSLLAGGFSTDSVDKLTLAFADIRVLSPEADIKSMAQRLAQIRATGRLQGDELNELANAWPAARDVIFKQLSKDLGKTQSELIAMQQAGKITPDMVEKALLGGVSALTKMDLGGFAKANADTIAGLFGRLQSIPTSILLGVDAGSAMEGTKAKLKEIIGFFDVSTESGQEVRKVLGDVIGAFAEGLFGIDASKGGGIKDTLQAILGVVRDSKDDIKAFGAGIASIGSAIAWFSGLGASIASARAEFAKLSGVSISGPFGILKGLLLGLPSLVLQTLSGVLQTITGFSLFDAGANLIKGLIGGMSSAVGGVWTAAKGAAQSAVDAVTGLWKVKSPSRLAIDIGGNFTKGLGIGVANDNGPSMAAKSIADDTASAATQTLGGGLKSSVSSTGSQSIAPVYAPVYHIGAGVGAAELDRLESIIADAQSNWERHASTYFTGQAQVA